MLLLFHKLTIFCFQFLSTESLLVPAALDLLLLNGNAIKFNNDFEFFVRIVEGERAFLGESLSSAMLWSLFAIFRSNQNPFFTFSTVRFWHEPPKLSAAFGPNIARSLIVRSLILKERFCSASRNIMLLECMAVLGKSTAQLYRSFNNCFCVEKVFARLRSLEFKFCLLFLWELELGSDVSEQYRKRFPTTWIISSLSLISYEKTYKYIICI